MLFTKATVASALVSAVAAAQHNITVGAGSALVFSPNSTVAAIGDTLLFQFFPKNHTVTQGSFATPCQTGLNVTEPIFSGFVATTEMGLSTFEVTVTADTPMWFYCSQKTDGIDHCAKGMVMVVNEKAGSANTLAVYAAGAAKMTASDTPPKAFGGNLVLASNSSSSTGSGATSTSAAGASKTSGSAASTSKSAAGNVVVSPFNMLSVGAAAVGALGFSFAL